MNDRNPVAEAGQAYLDRVWDAEKYRDELKDQLGAGADIGELLESGVQPGQFIERAGGLADLLRIIAHITELEGALKDAEVEYIKARRFAEAVESAEMHDEVGLGEGGPESFGQRVDPGLASDEAAEPFRGRPIADNPQA